jgi:UDP-glucose 4-epimerase
VSQRILVTGGTGFIGSHTCVALSAAGYTPLILDNLSNSDLRVIECLGKITGSQPRCIQGDVRDRALLDRLFRDEGIDGVIHLAGLKTISDSMADPLSFYDNNVQGSLTLAAAMRAAGVKVLIFSSSATVYGEPERCPIPESASCRPVNPYGHSKRVVEQALSDLYQADPAWRIMLLRYFNPIGAHESGLIGDSPRDGPNNLLPAICDVAAGLRDKLTVQGHDYPTPDGTARRDYIHVMDIAEAHVVALRYAQQKSGLWALNLGTGEGHSVLDVVRAFERVSGRQIAYELGPRRSRDVPAYWADPSLAYTTLGWKPQRSLDAMCQDSWRWRLQ